MSTGYFMDDIAIEYREEIEILRQKDEAHTEARLRMASEIESLTAERDRLRAALLHPFLNQVLGDIEDSDANDQTWEAAKAWIDLRDDILKGR